MDEQSFRRESDRALEDLNRALLPAADEYEFETDFNAGALSAEFEQPPARFVVSPNAPVRQIWVSALSKSYKLEWRPERDSFVLPDNGMTLRELMADRISELLGENVKL